MLALTVLKEEDKAKTDIPDDWYNDVGDVSREFGKNNKTLGERYEMCN